MAKKEKTKENSLKKGASSFQLVGKAAVNDFTFKINEESKHSDWVYNVLNLGVDCGDYGTIYCGMMGGYGAERNNLVYVNGKKENDNGNIVDDYSNRWEIDWEDRLDESLHEEVGEGCFYKIGIEKDSKGNTFSKQFLSEYDAIEYLKEHLEDGMVVNIKGKLEYSEYNDSIQVKKKVQSIFLSKADSPEKYKAQFTQTILVDKDSLGKADKDKNTYPIDAYVVEYIGKPKIDGKKIEIKKNVLFEQQYDFEIKDEAKTEKLVKKLFQPKKSSLVFEVTVEGSIKKGGASITATYEDLPEDIQELVDLEALTLEEALEKCVGNSNSPETFVIKNPKINKVGEDKTPVLAINKDKYDVNDYLFLADVLPSEDEDEEVANIVENANTDEEDDEEDIDMDALLDEIE